MDLDKDMSVDLVSNTRRILRLEENELRVTDNALICKNPNYPLCDAMLSTDVVYPLEYLLSFWECRSGRGACFVFKNTGCRVSLSCYVGCPERLRGLKRVCDFNFLNVNESLAVTLADIERIKPCDKGVLTNCVVRKSNSGMTYSIEVVAFGPDNEVEYEALLREIYVRGLGDGRGFGTDAHASASERFGGEVAEGRVIDTQRRWRSTVSRYRSVVASPSLSRRKVKTHERERRDNSRDVGSVVGAAVGRGPETVSAIKSSRLEKIVAFFGRYGTLIHLTTLLLLFILLFVVCAVYWYASRTKSYS